MLDRMSIDIKALGQALDLLNAGVYVTDRSRRILLWNRKAEEITGYPAGEVVGRACHDDILSHTDRHGNPLCSSNLCPLYRAMRNDSAGSDPVLIYAKRRDGDRIAVTTSVAPLRDSEQNIVGGIEVFHDQTRNVEDLEFAKSIQQNLLPGSLPELCGVRFNVLYRPRSLVGGDYYDVSKLDDRRVGMFIADARGHGVSAALYMMLIRNLQVEFNSVSGSPGRMLTAFNQRLSRFIVPESFVTAFYAIIDPYSGNIVYSSAGHPLPLIIREGGVEAIGDQPHGLPLGVSEKSEYSQNTVPINSGDRLVGYTDGATEVFDKDGRMLGREGLSKLLVTEEIIDDGALDRVYRRIYEFCDDVELPDDILLLSADLKKCSG